MASNATSSRGRRQSTPRGRHRPPEPDVGDEPSPINAQIQNVTHGSDGPDATGTTDATGARPASTPGRRPTSLATADARRVADEAKDASHAGAQRVDTPAGDTANMPTNAPGTTTTTPPWMLR